ncbi:MAG: hypothetical protein ACKV22_22855 [Bryobacteraceae bacterium]
MLLASGALALVGFGMTIAAGILHLRRRPSFAKFPLLIGGILLLSPALWFAIGLAPMLLQDLFPRNESWDFSASRDVTGLDPRRRSSVDRTEHDTEYAFQGSIRSAIRLPGDRRIVGLAYIIRVEAMRGQIVNLNWHGKNRGTDAVYEETKQMLETLRIGAAAIEAWRTKLRNSEPSSFSTESTGKPRIRVEIRRVPDGGLRGLNEKSDWYLSVEAEWPPAPRL